MKNCTVIHSGVQHSGLVARALHSRGRLLTMITRLQIGDAPVGPLKYTTTARGRLGQIMENRTVPGLPDRLIARVGLSQEFLRRLPVVRRSLPSRRFLEDRFQAQCLRHIPAGTKYLLLTDYGALHIMLATADLGIQRVLDLSQPLAKTVQDAISEDMDAHGYTRNDYSNQFAPCEDERVIQEVDVADKVIVASEFTRSSVMRESPNADVTVVPYGFDLPSSSDCRPRRPGPLRLLFVGALSEHKGISLLAKAMREINSRHSGVRLDVVGRSAKTTSLPAWSSNVTLHGSAGRTYVSRMYTEADYLVLPSISEGFGRVIVEALSHGCGVVTTERTAAPDVLRLYPDAPVHICPVAERDRLADMIEPLTDALGEEQVQARRHHAIAAASQFTYSRYAEALDRAMSPGPEYGHGDHSLDPLMNNGSLGMS